MALDSAVLKGDLKPEIEAQMRSLLNLGSTPYPDLTKFADALATAIATKVVAHIKSNAELDNAKFSGSYGVTGGSGGTVTITNQPVSGGVK